MNEEEKRIVAGVPFYRDLDLGLTSIWERVYMNCKPGNLANASTLRLFRANGLQFWSSARFESPSLRRRMENLVRRRRVGAQL